eukprot:TRINITY_DN13273_c0_g1_i1.p1 TRINITY_DN13273_c0_g1~~TRINITY_DN13273_c0_g1_i1.p1  ORF type:complete len:417 (-),score=135.65 TRINITY_DN13273_c0_g1_i1:853-2103(-)
MATPATAQPGATRASLAQSPPAISKDAHQEPTAGDAPVTLDVGTLQQALNAVLLSGLAYKTPREVEYLRMRANKSTQEQALQAIQAQAGGTMPAELDPAKVKALEADNDAHKYTDILEHCAEPSQYFDGRHSLFVDTTEAYVLLSQTPKGQPNVLYVVFRGTSDNGDKLADVEFAQVQIAPEPSSGAKSPIEDIKDIKIHRGFRDQFLAVSTALTRNVEAAAREVAKPLAAVTPVPVRMTDTLKATIVEQAAIEEKLDAGGFEVVVTGHSLGAALATIGTFVAALEHPGVRVSFFGFGSPRVGNKRFVDAFKVVLKHGAAHHFANEHDVVTGIPGAVFFCHVPGGVMLREEGGKVRAFPLKDETSGLSSAAEWVTRSVDFVRWYAFQRGTVPWSQHDMSLYIKRVRALLQQAQAGQ